MASDSDSEDSFDIVDPTKCRELELLAKEQAAKIDRLRIQAMADGARMRKEKEKKEEFEKRLKKLRELQKDHYCGFDSYVVCHNVILLDLAVSLLCTGYFAAGSHFTWLFLLFVAGVVVNCAILSQFKKRNIRALQIIRFAIITVPIMLTRPSFSTSGL